MAKDAQSIRDLNKELQNSLAIGKEISEAEFKVAEYTQNRIDLLDEELKKKGELSTADKDLVKTLNKGLKGSKVGLAIWNKWLQVKSKIGGYDNEAAQAATDMFKQTKKTFEIGKKWNKLKEKALKLQEKISKFSDATGMNEGLGEMDGMIGGIGSKLIKFIKNPLLLIGAALGLTVAAYGRYSDTIDKTGALFGGQVSQADDLKSAMLDVNAEGAELDINVRTIGDMMDNVADSFGLASAESVKLAANMKRTGMAVGLSNQQSTDFFNNMMNITGLSYEQSDNFAKGVYELARQNKVAPAKVMQDMAESAGFTADFVKDGGTNLAAAAINAKKFGLSLKTVEKVANKLLDFESGIAAEMEASVMIGRNLNFNAARRLALEGDVDGAMQDIINQLGGAEEFAEMDVLQRRALADAIGVSTEELAKFMNKSDKVKEATGVTAENIKATGNMKLIDGASALSDMTLLQNSINNMPDIIARDMQEPFEKVDGVLKTIKESIQWIIDTLGGAGFLIGMGLAGVVGWMFKKVLNIKKIWKTLKGWFGKGSKDLDNVAKKSKKIKKKGKPKAKGKAKKGLFGRIGGWFGKKIKAAKKGLKKIKPKKGWFSGLKNAGSKLWGGIKGAGKWIGKKVGKGAIKGLLKKIPGVGLIAGLGYGVSRAMSGDWKGALGEIASGAASTIPGLGTVASTAIDGVLMARDAGMMGDGMSIGGGPATVIRGGKIFKTDSADDLMAYNAQRMAQLGGSGFGGMGDDAVNRIVAGFRAAVGEQKVVVTKDQIEYITEPRGY